MMIDDEFHFEEYRALRREIEQGIEELRKSRRNALVAVFGFYAWLATGGLLGQSTSGSPVHHFNDIAWWLPSLIPIFGFVEYLGIMRRTLDIAGYLKCLESHYAKSVLEGWEHNLAKAREERPFQAQAQGWSGFLLWPLLFAITITVAMLA